MKLLRKKDSSSNPFFINKKNDNVFLISLITSFTPPPHWTMVGSPEATFVQRFHKRWAQNLLFNVRAETVDEGGKSFKHKNVGERRYIKFKFHPPLQITTEEITETAKSFFLEICDSLKFKDTNKKSTQSVANIPSASETDTDVPEASKKTKRNRAGNLQPDSIQLFDHFVDQNHLITLTIEFHPTDDSLNKRENSAESILVKKINRKTSSMCDEVYAETCDEHGNSYVGKHSLSGKYIKLTLALPLDLGNGDDRSKLEIIQKYFSDLRITICYGIPLPDRNTYYQQVSIEQIVNVTSIIPTPILPFLNNTTNDFAQASASISDEQSLNLNTEHVLDLSAVSEPLLEEDIDFFASLQAYENEIQNLPEITPQFSHASTSLVNQFNKHKIDRDDDEEKSKHHKINSWPGLEY